MNTNRPGWHVAEADLVGYARERSTAVLSTSIEAHLLGCPACRDRLARVADSDEREAAWDRLADSIDRPSPGPLARLTGGHRLARSAVATPPMLAAALIAVALVATVPLAAALVAGDAALVSLLVLAPLAPVAAVGLAYRDWADPAGEIVRATPAAGLRLVAMRALVVSAAALALAVVALVVVDAWVEVPTTLVFAWCLPGLALASLVLLAGTTRLDPLLVATTLSAGWAVLVVTGPTLRRSLDPDALLGLIASPTLQAAALAIAVCALFLTAARRDAVSYRRTT